MLTSVEKSTGKFAGRWRALAAVAVATIAPLCGQDIHPWLAGSSGAIYYNGGNVGIGTSNPLNFVQAHAGTNLNLGVRFDSQTGAVGLGAYNDAGTTPTPLGFNASQFLFVNGNVGIGTTSPSYRLHVVDSHLSLPVAHFHHTGNADSPGTALRVSNGYPPVAGNYEVFGAYGNNFLNNYLSVRDNGNVGIGTTTPTHKLAVNGTIRTKEVVVDTGWADYVFEPEYRVRPLSEVHTYIQQHRRLPDMPSAEEVRDKGVGLGEMQVKLLAKIEEMTLHMIQMERQNKELQARVTELESRRAQ